MDAMGSIALLTYLAAYCQSRPSSVGIPLPPPGTHPFFSHAPAGMSSRQWRRHIRGATVLQALDGAGSRKTTQIDGVWPDAGAAIGGNSELLS